MIRIITPEIKHFYSCQSCGIHFEGKEDLKMDYPFEPVCSSRCAFLMVYNNLKKQQLSDEMLMKMQCFVENKQEITNFDSRTALFSITKYYFNKGLANIKQIIMDGQGFVQLDKNLSEWTIGQENPPYIIGGLSKVLSKDCPEQDFSLVQRFCKKEVIKQWF